MRIRAALLAVLLTAVGCGSGAPTGAAPDPDAPLRVGVSPVPHAQVLRYVADNLAASKGLEVEVVEFTDYVQPNTALVDGSLDANYFQTVPYLDTFTSGERRGPEWIGPVHVEPLGVYEQARVARRPARGGRVAVANDVTNEARGLVVQDNGLIKLKAGTEKTATVRDIEDNPKDLEFVELEAAQLPRSLEDTDASVVNGNYAIDAGLKPAEDALALEAAEGNPNANGLVTRAELKGDKRIADLLELLQSQQVKDYIRTEFAGSVLAV
ncbi:metal ABC transporter substrate-binding protein [Saccharothrix sp. MB29]|nr:metal ABC transporter substrate-binding protein [Saccharothrix sp. MB29]